jgi:hypothetical protein
MQDYLAYLTGQRLVRDLTTSALPGAPVRADPEAPIAPGRSRLRRRVAGLLVRAAERLEAGAVGASRS